MKYRCSHCNHIFELQDRAFHRCPNCFWTTSLVSVEAEGGQPLASETAPSSAAKPSAQAPFGKGILKPLIVVIFLGVSAFVFFKMGKPIPQFSIKLPAWTSKQEAVGSRLKKISSKHKPPQAVESLLTEAERAQLAQPFQISIPRQLSEDEEEILKKQVSFPAQLAKKPVLTIWKKEDFERTIQSEQDKRKIRLGWSYVRSLIKTFERHYVPAVQAFEAGDYVLAREFFIKSLTFSIYRNDPKRHRAVALVMLRPYINEVIGKVAVLNQYLLSQTLLTEAHTLFQSYQALFSVLELQEWEHALQLIEELKKQTAAFENRPQDAQVNYPPDFRALDSEIQVAIQTEAAPKPEAAVNLKALVIDLGLKEKVVRENTAEELVKAQKQYEQVSRLLEERDWQAARDGFMAIEYPPELAREAKKKLALIEKVLALQESGGK